MKNYAHLLLLATLPALFIFGCGQGQGKMKITELPVSTSSPEAKQSFKQAMQMLDQGDLQQARELFTKAIEKDPKLSIAYAMRANTANSPEEFADDISKAKENVANGTKWEKWYVSLQETFLTGEAQKRLQIAQMIADTFPNAARAQTDLGNSYSQNNDETKARECFQKAIDLDSNWVGGYSAMSASYLGISPKDFKKAEDYAAKAVAHAPSSPAEEVALGDSYRAENDLSKARDAYAKAVTLDPNVSVAYYKEGHANTLLGNYDQARQNYIDGSKYDVGMVNANQFIALTYVYQGDYKRAQAMLIEYANDADSTDKSPDQAENDKLIYLNAAEQIAIHYEDANALKALLPKTEALSMAQANKLGTNGAKAIAQGGILYNQGMLSAIEGNYDDAKAKADQIKSTLDSITDPNKLSQYHFLMGYISMKEKNFGDAISHFQESNPDLSIYTTYWLAKANEAAGNKDKADALYKEISVFNFNGINYALIRNEVLSRNQPS